MNVKIDENFLQGMAAIVAEHPTYTMKELAEAAGISKATIHRVYGTREQLLELIQAEKNQKLEEILEIIKTPQENYEKWLDDMIKIHFAYKEYILFNITVYKCGVDDYTEKYTNSMNDFFENGKKTGLLNSSINANVLTELFTASICGFFSALRKGLITSADAEKDFRKFLENGMEINK